MTPLEAFQAYYAGGAMRRSLARTFAAWGRYREVAREVDALGDNLLVLDVGCGHGETARMLAQRHRLVGVDIAPSAAEGFSRFGFAVIADALALPFEDGSFDVVLCGQTLYHLPLDAALDELARVTKLSGRLVLEQGMAADVSLWPQRAYWAARRRLPGRLRLDYASGRTGWRTLRKALRRRGFEPERRVGLEIAMGPFYRERLARRAATVLEELPRLASHQLIVCVRT